MKKNLVISVVVLLIYKSFNCFSQERLKKWYISPKQVDVTAVPVVSNITGATATTNELCNGIYEPNNLNGSPMFYIADDPSSGFPIYDKSVFDRNNNVMGFLSGYTPQKTSEFAIVPFPDNNGCTINKYYIFYCSAIAAPLEVQLRNFVVDMNGNGGLGTLTGPFWISTIPASEWGGIAVGAEVNGTRFLYFCGGSTLSLDGGQIEKVTITASGIMHQNLYTHFSNLYDFETSEMDLSPNGDMLAFASNYSQLQSPPRYYIIGLNATGDFSFIRTFNVGTDNSPGGRGVEFYRESNGATKLLVGAGSDGIYRIDPNNPSVGQTPILLTSNYGFSQIERGFNGRMYVGSSTKIAAIDVGMAIPALDPAYDIALVPPSSLNPGTFFNLLDQIDEENYDVSITPFEPIDLYMKDYDQNGGGHFDDTGIEPNPDNEEMWISNDIWVRQNQDPTFIFQGQHENPEYWVDPTHYNWVYVRIRNESCVDFIPNANDLLHIYWAKASTGLAWPGSWNGSQSMACTDINGIPSNPRIGSPLSPTPFRQIPAIPAGSSVILEFPWYVPNPDDWHGCNPDYKHFCLVARIVSPQDPLGVEVPSQYANTQNYNNIIWKNFEIVNISSGIVGNEDCFSDRQVGGAVGIGNPFDRDDIYNFDFKVDKNFQGKPIFEQAEIKITLDKLAWDKWAAGGYQGENVRVKREDCRQLVVLGSPASLNNLAYASMERSIITMSFNFLTEEVDNIPEFDYHVIQTRKEDNSIIGGELYRIQKPSRYLFNANGGGDKNILPLESVQLSANSIGEQAYYNWYDQEDNLIYSGENFTVTPEITTKYKLEVIALSDGFTSNDEVEVQVKEKQIVTITPNPASGQVTVEYYAGNSSSTYLSISQTNSNSNNNYIVDPTLSSTVLNLSGYMNGNYLIRLICDGVIKDEKTLVIIQ